MVKEKERSERIEVAVVILVSWSPSSGVSIVIELPGVIEELKNT